jgi:hypothetical protein
MPLRFPNNQRVTYLTNPTFLRKFPEKLKALLS